MELYGDVLLRRKELHEQQHMKLLVLDNYRVGVALNY